MARVRFAPSPTGFLHIGGARTALFNWLYAKAQGGQFILRIEDTDRERSKREYLDEILEGMQWLGLSWDELHKQSDRFAIYREHAQRLLTQGKAYKDGEAVILKMSAGLRVDQPIAGNSSPQLVFYDLIRDKISFEVSEIKDQVLIKSDGSPAYNFACVVDDALMEISCVIRGEDHISNTPKQLAIYEALGFKSPKFAHLPLILDAEGGRMSKRHGAVAVSEYRRMGFLPQALVNYLMLLGWSPAHNQEIVSLSTAIKNFSIKKINKAGAAFSMEKLEWINAQYLRQMDTPSLTKMLIPFAKEHGLDLENFDSARLENIVHLVKSRMTTLKDFLAWTEFIFTDEVKIDPQARAQYLTKNKSKEFQLLSQRLQQIKDFNLASAEETFRKLIAELGIQSSELVHSVRVALTGKSVGPGLFETMAVLGKEKTVQRLARTRFQQ